MWLMSDRIDRHRAPFYPLMTVYSSPPRNEQENLRKFCPIFVKLYLNLYLDLYPYPDLFLLFFLLFFSFILSLFPLYFSFPGADPVTGISY